METNTFRILFYLKKTKILKNGEAPVFMRITTNGERVDISTHRSINDKLWDQKKGVAMGNTTKSHTLNEYLEHLKSRVYQYKKQLEIEDQIASATAIRDLLQNKGEHNKNVIAVFTEHNTQCYEKVGRGMAAATVTRYETTMKHLRDFIKQKHHANDYPLRAINHQFIKDFEHYLMTTRKCNRNTTSKYLGNFKKIIRLARFNDWIKKDPFQNVKIRFEEVDRDYLSETELWILIEKKFSNDRLEKVKDIYLFCCFTGLAYADVCELSADNIVIGIDGNIWVRTKRKKTSRRCDIPLLEIPQAIIKKYENDSFCQVYDKLLPVRSNQKMNEYLKEIAAICGIEKNLTFHTARHTFATTVTLTNKVAIEAVSKMLGHSSINMTKRYARIVDTLVGHEMAKIKSRYNFDEHSNSKGDIGMQSSV
jgi:site-specific recombinase XerD